MYFGKPIPEWIAEHRDDTVTLGEIVDACETSERVLNNLSKKALEGEFCRTADLSAYAFFQHEILTVNKPVSIALDILGKRYGYPENPEEEDE